MMMDTVRTRFFRPTVTDAILLVLAILLLLGQCLLLYGHTGRDDAFLTYWPAVTLAEHGAILNYNGEAVEQSSTLLLMLALAALHKLLPAIAMPTSAWMLSLLAGTFTLLLTAGILRQRQQDTMGALALAATPGLVFWSSSGMETLAITALLTAILLLSLRDAPGIRQKCLLALAVSLAVLCRPETVFVLLAFTAAAWTLTRTRHSHWLLLTGVALLSFALVSWWRHHTFGMWFPQPVSAKSGETGAVALLKGIAYIKDSGQSVAIQAITASGLLAGVIALLYRRHPQRKAILACWSLALAQLAFILATGGDWMEAARFLVPALPALLLCSLLLLAPWQRLQHAVLALLLATALLDSWQFAQQKSTGFAITDRQPAQQQYLAGLDTLAPYSATELQTKDALRDIPQLEHLRQLVGTLLPQEKPLHIASIQMGFIPYHLARQFYAQPSSPLRFLDLRGLSTRELTDCKLHTRFRSTDTGLKISYDEFFALLPQFQRQCGISKPDIIYDLGYDMRKDVLARNGYVITYLEKRHVTGSFSRRYVGSELFVAVRRELAVRHGLHDFAGQPVTPDPQTLPNIVLLLADDISYDHFGFMGNAAAHTPTLDELAQRGTVFSSGYAPTAFCRPSLATLLTGSWPHQHRLHANNGVIAMPAGYTSLATLLQQRGYATFAGGKFWEDEPELRGFDSFDVDKESFARKNQDALWQFLDHNAGQKPLFVWWAPMLPHTPHNPPQAFLNAIDRDAIPVPAALAPDQQQDYRNKTQNLLAMTAWMDDEISQLYRKLAEKNQLDNTLVVFLSDNGFSHRAVSKSSPYELGLRTPILFNWPGHIPARRIDTTTSLVNVYNTVLDYAAVSPLPADRPQPGHSLRPVLEQRAEPVMEKQFGADYQAVTMKTDPAPRPERDIFALHVRDGDWKYIFYLRDLREENNNDLTIKSGMQPFPTRNAGDEELYYLPADPYEENNLATAAGQGTRLEDYRRQVLDWWFSTGGKPFDAATGCPAHPLPLCGKMAAVRP